MKTIRTVIESFVYEHIAYFVDLVAKGGEDTVYEGIRVLDEKEKFVHGALVDTTAALYVWERAHNSANAPETFKRLQTFIGYATKEQCKTWGKLALLRALTRLHKANCLDLLPKETLLQLKEKTQYTDFFDKDTLSVIDLPSNYVQVALACAGYREALGWDTDPFSEQIKETLMEIMAGSSDTGWMDEQPPQGRFDRYSILISSEIYDNFSQFGKSIPDSVKKNLLDAAELTLFMANTRGDGINYGRSLSCHGDAASLEILGSALACGLLDPSDYDRAVNYSLHILEKILTFWYRSEKKSFDIWWNGRTTNSYRGVHRVLEVNLDMSIHLLTTLRNFETAGLADYEPKEPLAEPTSWTAQEICFLENENRAAKTVVCRRNDLLVMLPLIGLGSFHSAQAYQPYPALCGALEGSPQGILPYLIPEYQLNDGAVVRPIQYYTQITTIREEDTVVVTAKGNLCDIGDKMPSKRKESFVSTYRFHETAIEATFQIDCPYQECRMLIGTHNHSTRIQPLGFTKLTPIATADPREFYTPHGAITEAVMATAKQVTDVEQSPVLGYQVTLL